jgi:hypothetical protein
MPECHSFVSMKFANISHCSCLIDIDHKTTFYQTLVGFKVKLRNGIEHHSCTTLVVKELPMNGTEGHYR